MPGIAPRIGVLAASVSDLADPVREAGGEPVSLALPVGRPRGGVALIREWMADAAQISCTGEVLDALLVAADEPEELAGLVLATLRLNLPTVASPSRDAHLSTALATLGLAPLAADPAEVAVEIARGGPRPRELVEGFALANALRASCSLGGDPETIVHLSAIAREADAPGFSQMLRVLIPETPPLAEPGSEWYKEHGAAGLLAHLGDALHDTRTVSGRLREALPPAPSAFPPATGSRLVFVRGRASGTEALCRAAGQETEVAGECRVLHSEKYAVRVVEGGSVEPRSLLLVDGCGPRGGPGLLRLNRLAQVLDEDGLAGRVPVITDGLPPRAARGTWISSFTPEAAAGGVLALLRDGDTLRFDLVEGLIRTNVRSEELRSRKPVAFPEPPRRGYAARYAAAALPALEGAGFG